MDARYRVVLTGELLQGHDREQAAQALAAMLKQPIEKIRVVLRGRATPLNKPLDFRGAREVEKRLVAIGVGCKIEAFETRAPAAFASKDPVAATPPPAAEPQSPLLSPRVAASASITCPRCHKVQPPADECSACGLLLKKPDPKFSLQAVEPRAEAPAVATGSFTAQTRPHDANEEERLMLFIGPRAERYMEKFEHFTPGKWSAGWNWAAFLFGGFWAAYRKMWLWAGALILSGFISYFSPLLALLIHLAFVVSADYLYYSHARKALVRLDGKPDETVAHAGGGHGMAVVLSLVVCGAVGAFAGVEQGKHGRMQQVVRTIQADSQIAGIIQSDAGRRTAGAFTLAAFATYQWHDAGGDLRLVSTDALLREGKIKEEMVKDGWGNAVKVMADNAGFIVVSAGGDGSFGSEDDIPVLFAVES